MEATKPTSSKRNPKNQKDRKNLSKELEQQLQDENLKVYHQLLWAEEQINRSR
ncbi:MAG: hypothetical protein G3M70_08350 [Candidatus Nitronauta litoralis]|uniref:Uncharacterized protein n=1 Tax=Candidatus Nitronauta litoralis TaxID=2705533 RepID=A0A7T0BWP9_9BACT|nr:MAG: hypothetical protein G3M70_08350 [Candidatus Nitronauta litoralis]